MIIFTTGVMKKLILICILAVNYLFSYSQNECLANFIVNSGNHYRYNTPVYIDLSSLGLRLNDSSLILFESIDGEFISTPSQIEHGHQSILWWILEGETMAKSQREYCLYYGEGAENLSTIKSELSDYNLTLSKDDNEILSYRYAMHYPPEGVPEIFKRSGFIHPMISPAGNVLTRINPPDHWHHYGIWNPWTKTLFRGESIDFWNLNLNQGTVEFAGLQSWISGPVFGEFKALQKHISFVSGKEETIVLNELLDTRVWNLSMEDKRKVYLIDYSSFLSCATPDEVLLEAYRYGGGIGFRATEEWTNMNSRVLTSEGLTRKDADASFGKWVDVNGDFANGTQSGILFMSSPTNRQHPESMRVWPEDSNNGRGDMYFEFCPIRHKSWTIKPGKEYTQRYRMLIYDGTINKETAERIWTDFAYPPVVTIKTYYND